MEPDQNSIRGDLVTVGFDPDQVEEILFDTYTAASHKDYVDLCSREIHRLLGELDLTEATRVTDQFERLGERL